MEAILAFGIAIVFSFWVWTLKQEIGTAKQRQLATGSMIVSHSHSHGSTHEATVGNSNGDGDSDAVAAAAARALYGSHASRGAVGRVADAAKAGSVRTWTIG